jgi:hypothetical protein
VLNILTKLLKNTSLTLGIVGLVLFTLALPLSNVIFKNVFFLTGASLLAIASLLEKETFFACLEGIVMITAILELCQVSQLYNAIILAVLVLSSIVLLLRTRQINLHLITGIIGLVLLNTGIIFSTNLLMFAAGLTLCLYSYLSAKSGIKVGWIFLALNIVFTGVAIINI